MYGAAIYANLTYQNTNNPFSSYLKSGPQATPNNTHLNLKSTHDNLPKTLPEKCNEQLHKK